MKTLLLVLPTPAAVIPGNRVDNKCPSQILLYNKDPGQSKSLYRLATVQGYFLHLPGGREPVLVNLFLPVFRACVVSINSISARVIVLQNYQWQRQCSSKCALRMFGCVFRSIQPPRQLRTTSGAGAIPGALSDPSGRDRPARRSDGLPVIKTQAPRCTNADRTGAPRCARDRR